MNDTTRRYPRNMNEAFGPDCKKHITEPERPYDWQDRAVLFACLALAVVGIVWCLS